jgi:predicted  nucleic acid-binding Zn-ribbon protein
MKFNILKFKKILSFLLTLSLISLVSVNILKVDAPTSIAQVSTQTKSKEELEKLQSELKDAQAKLESVKKQKEDVKKQIDSEAKNQTKLTNETKQIDQIILQNKLQAEGIELELGKLEIELKIIKEEKSQIEERLVDIESQITRLTKEHEESLNLLYKMALNSPSLLDNDSNFQDSIINGEKIKSAVKIVKFNIEEIKKLEADVKSKQDQIVKKEQEVADLQATKQAQTENLKLQRDGLAWQQNNKKNLIEVSKQKTEDLDHLHSEISDQIKSLESQVSNIKSSLYSAPPSGSKIAAGQIIGFQGRSGYVCGYIADISKYPKEDYTNKYCSAPLYYFYDPVKYPRIGSHLHFEYKKNKNSPLTYPAAYLTDPANNPEFEHLPMDKFAISQGSHQGGAIDLDGGHGAPIYAIKSGSIQYLCYSFERDPWYVAVIYHDDGSISQYWHMDRRPNSPPCTTVF